MGNHPCFCDAYNDKQNNQGEVVIGKGAFKFKKIVYIIYIIYKIQHVPMNDSQKCFYERANIYDNEYNQKMKVIKRIFL